MAHEIGGHDGGHTRVVKGVKEPNPMQSEAEMSRDHFVTACVVKWLNSNAILCPFNAWTGGPWSAISRLPTEVIL